ncbi:MAG: redox-regulated ATPase YchF [Polyangiaceae bacterium]
MGFSCGIVGLPNVGKSTLFNSLSTAKAEAQNFPFCTIEPNVGIVPVPDPRLDALAKLFRPQRVVPTTIRFVDIAGLVRGASKGEGLGNQFLSHIREVDAIAQVVRCFDDDNITHVAGKIDPISDVETIETELCLKDLDTAAKRLDRAQKQSKGGDPKELLALKMADKLVKHLDAGHPARTLELDEKEAPLLAEMQLLTSKPMFFVANVDESSLSNLAANKHYQALVALAAARKSRVVPICAALEAQIAELDPSDRPEFLASAGLTEPGLYQVIRTGYELLGLLTFLTAGEDECRAWTVHQGATAPEAAGVIHTDFQRGFIKAEVIWWEDSRRAEE